MRIIVALGGNALLRRGETLTAENQRRNIKIAAEALVPMVLAHELVISHGNGPQVGLLALQGATDTGNERFPLDVLDAETEGMIGYMIEQEMINLLPEDRPCVCLLTQIEVNPEDQAFRYPSKPIGPVYTKSEADRLAKQSGWHIARDGEHYRRVVASPRPECILEQDVIERLVQQGVLVICTGGGGIPVIRRKDGTLIGIEAVIDKDLASALLARELKADAFLMLTDVEAVYKDWSEPNQRAIRRISAQAIQQYAFAAGSMQPKIKAACEFVQQSSGLAGIGRLQEASAILAGEAGTMITNEATDTLWWD